MHAWHILISYYIIPVDCVHADIGFSLSANGNRNFRSLLSNSFAYSLLLLIDDSLFEYVLKDDDTLVSECVGLTYILYRRSWNIEKAQENHRFKKYLFFICFFIINSRSSFFSINFASYGTAMIARPKTLKVRTKRWAYKCYLDYTRLFAW